MRIGLNMYIAYILEIVNTLTMKSHLWLTTILMEDSKIPLFYRKL